MRDEMVRSERKAREEQVGRQLEILECERLARERSQDALHSLLLSDRTVASAASDVGAVAVPPALMSQRETPRGEEVTYRELCVQEQKLHERSQSGAPDQWPLLTRSLLDVAAGSQLASAEGHPCLAAVRSGSVVNAAQSAPQSARV